MKHLNMRQISLALVILKKTPNMMESFRIQILLVIAKPTVYRENRHIGCRMRYHCTQCFRHNVGWRRMAHMLHIYSCFPERVIEYEFAWNCACLFEIPTVVVNMVFEEFAHGVWIAFFHTLVEILRNLPIIWLKDKWVVVKTVGSAMSELLLLNLLSNNPYTCIKSVCVHCMYIKIAGPEHPSSFLVLSCPVPSGQRIRLMAATVSSTPNCCLTTR